MLRSRAPLVAVLYALFIGPYPAASQTPGAWTVAGPMATARYNAGDGVLLENGKVLIAGGGVCGPGCPGASPLSGAELYDPATGNWSATARMNVARQGHTVTRLSDGRILAAGGLGVASAELYDPATDTWTLTGSMSAPHGYHTATLLPNGQVLVAGGYNGAVYATADLYDPVSGTWSATGPMASARYAHSAALLPTGKVLVMAGGSTSAEVYDPATGTWSMTGSMKTARYAPAVALPSGNVLVPAGQAGYAALATGELYDAASGTWAATGSVADPRAGHSATLLADGRVLVAAGLTGSLNCALACAGLTSAEIYEPATGTWSATGSMATMRYGHAAVRLPDGGVVIAGGNGTNSASLRSTERFTPPTSDADADEVVDSADNCPAVSNADQADGDADGIGNACDIDDDNDAVPDGSDNCALAANVDQTDSDADGAGDTCDADDDGDDVSDASDVFPLNPLEWRDNDADGLGDNSDPDDDNDGIADTVDAQPTIVSNAFSDAGAVGTTSGVITATSGWIVRVVDLTPGGVQITATGAGTLATVATCANGGPEQVEFDGPGETADVQCVNTTGTNTGSMVLAQTAAGPLPLRTVVRDSAGKVKAKLPTGQAATIGSPVTAAPTNTVPIDVDLFGSGDVVVGSFSLDAGESVDVQFHTVPDGERLQLTVLAGVVTAIVHGQERTMTADSGASIFNPLVFIGPLSPYGAPPASFRIPRSIPLKWQYAAAGEIIDSMHANPVVRLYRAAACASMSDDAPVPLEDAGTSGYQYDAVSRTWQFNWKTTGLAAGCYDFTVTHMPASLTHGPFRILLR